MQFYAKKNPSAECKKCTAFHYCKLHTSLATLGTLEPTYRQLQTMKLDKSPFVIISVIGQELLAQVRGRKIWEQGQEYKQKQDHKKEQDNLK